MKKEIGYLLTGREKSIGVEKVIQSLPHKDFRFASPFVVLHHLPPQDFAAESPPERIPPHPHRGFAPVTFLFQGEGFHKDSKGNSGIIRAGGVQWMFAGSGLLHSEGPTKELLEKGGTYEFVQLWINVPAAHKLDEPYYQQAAREQLPLLVEEAGIDIRLACGALGATKGPLRSFTPIVAAFGSLDAHKSIRLTATEGYWTLLYVLEGTLLVNEEKEIGAHQLAVFEKEGTEISLSAQTPVKLVYLSGEPIEEPVAAKGNFVMNTAPEVEQAEKDYAAGKFGVLTD